MILDLLESYQQISKGSNLALDNYRLKEGLYVKLKTTVEVECYKVDKNQDMASEIYIWFRNRDFRSGLVDMNKSVDPKKKIHSNNGYSVFFKSPNPEEKITFLKVIAEHMERYFITLRDQKENHLLGT